MKPQAAGKCFLLADDDSDDKELFSEALASIDDSIVCYMAADGSEALNILNDPSTVLPQVIFLDINMPGMDGWECLKSLKNHPRYHSIPVVMYSTSSHQREIDVALNLGALCYFTKPNDYRYLQKALTIIVENADRQLLKAMKEFGGFKCREN